MIELWGYIGVDSIEEILKLLSGVDIGDICKNFHLFLELILEETVVNTNHAFDIYPRNDVFHEILRMETGFDEIDATHEPFFTGFALL